VEEVEAADPFERALLRAANQFIVDRGRDKTIIAGYHWFSDWGRDTMIALPGLTLATGRFEDARGILRAFAASVDRGMLPNRFPDAGETPEYNTVDATLWFFEAVRAYVAHTGDMDFVRAELLDVLGEIVAWHEAGTRYGIRVDDDGLLRAGEPGVQLTWMDSKIGDWVVTPRHGKPVEIQALWYNALRVMQDLTGHAHYAELANRARESFPRQFWNEAAGCLYDVVDGDCRDGSIRPNQIFAVSLFHSMLPAELASRVLDIVTRDLLTPYGLRSLAPSDPRYRGRYGGDPVSRDSAYHQGTVWPWLMGAYVSAHRRVYGHSPDWMEPFRRFIREEGGGQIPEVFDGDAPHRPGGCMAQAWSVAELLRCLREERQAARRTAAGVV
jgi:predicted glycogen debranching enzyme